MLKDEMQEQTTSHAADDWQDLELRFEHQQEAFLRKIESFQQDSLQFYQYNEGFRQERDLYHQEQVRLLKDLRARRQLRDRGEPTDPVGQNLLQRMQEFSETLAQLQQGFNEMVRIVQERLDALHERYLILKELADPAQQQADFQELRTAYRQLLGDLQEYRRFLREQQADYRQLRLDYRAGQQQIAAQRSAIRQRQEEQRWRKYMRGGGELLVV